ncbi:MAG TPA: hypothetical protein VE402_04770 [Candidatus Angelobacter sp.]|nr:hypothetical protein [Candidatus Angelobacter sp.]
MRIDNNRNLFLALIIGSLAALVMCAAIKAQAATEIIPSAGLTRGTDSDDTKAIYGLALRTSAIPSLVDLELKGQYRNQMVLSGAAREHQWPVSASLWLTPLRALYAGAGVGWYHTTLDFQGPTAPPTETFEKFGVHAGGGLRVPFGSAAALDLNGRYVWMENQESVSIPQKFDPDFWDMSLGLAFRFSGGHHD